jgi:hypothetical protein
MDREYPVKGFGFRMGRRFPRSALCNLPTHKMRQRFQFDFDKALEAILYIARRVPAPTFHKISKILYFADLDHLQSYGRFILGDRYIAMEFGPVPSETNNIMRAARGEQQHDGKREAIQSALEVPGQYTIRALRGERQSVFSRSDIECIDRAIEAHSHKSFGQLTDESHDAAWHATAEGQEMDLNVIVGMLPDAELIREHLEIGRQHNA